MRKPEALKAGDKVGLICTARKVSTEDLSAFYKTMEEWSLNVVNGKTIGAVDNQYGGDDSLRIKDLQLMLNDPEIKAVFCARGGYGTVRIIDHVNFTRFLQDPKWFVGYSDITVLHAFLQEKLAMCSVHGIMPFEFGTASEENLSSLKNALFGNTNTYTFKAHPLNRGALMEGKLMGGNLSVLYSINGTVAGFNPGGKILFLEDLDEYLYHIDRMMMQLKRSGKLEVLDGLLVGGMSDMHDNTVPFGKNAEEIIYDAVKEYDFPVVFNFPAGHGKQNLGFHLGAKISIKRDGDQMIALQE